VADKAEPLLNPGLTLRVVACVKSDEYFLEKYLFTIGKKTLIFYF